MSREIKLGLLTLITAIVAIWGYTFIKGSNLFQKSSTFKTSYSDVTGLDVSSIVMLNGLKVGVVTSIKMNEANVKLMDVEFRVDGDLDIPKSTKVIQKPESIVGGKILALEFDKICTGTDCAASGDFLEGVNVGLLGSMVTTSEVSEYIGAVKDPLQELLATLGAEGSEGALNETFRHLAISMENIAKLTASLDQLILSNQKSLSATLANANSITGNLSKSNEDIAQILSNFEKISQQLAASGLDSTLMSVNSFVGTTNGTMEDLSSTLVEAKKTLNEFSQIAEKINDKEGTINKLLNDPDLYNNVENTTKHLSLLLQDFRLNPKRYLNISLINRNKTPYIPADEDPALDTTNVEN